MDIENLKMNTVFPEGPFVGWGTWFTDLLPESTDLSDLNMLYLMKHGERTVCGNVPINTTQLEKYIRVYFSDKWTTLFEHNKNINKYVNDGLYDSETMSENVIDSGSISFTSLDDNKVSAYNTESYVNNNTSDKTEESSTNNTKLREYEMKKPKKLVDYKEVMTDTNNFLEVVFDDFNSLTTLAIFN